MINTIDRKTVWLPSFVLIAFLRNQFSEKIDTFFYDFYGFKCGLTQLQCIDKFHSAFVDEEPSKTTVFNWFGEFQRWRASASDEFREGRPSTAVVSENINAVLEMIVAHRLVTYREIEESLAIRKSQIQTILLKHLVAKKLCSRWILYNLTEAPEMAHVSWCKKIFINSIAVL